MVTKLTAAKIALESGFTMVITNSDDVNHLYQIVRGEPIGTRFEAKS